MVPTVESSGAQQPTRVDSLRTLRMNTNATPNYGEVHYGGQEPPMDNTNKEITADVEATQPLSPQLALLARQRRALQVKEREIQQREKALSENNSRGSSIELAKLKSDPIGVMLQNGITYDDLTQAILNGQGNSEVNALKAELDALRSGIDKKFEDQNTHAEKQVLSEMKREAEKLTYSSDEYELIKETKGVPHVMSLIERTYRKTGEVLDVSDAMRLVEDELFKDYQKIASLKKLQRFQSPGTPMQDQGQRRPQGMRTLTNRDTAQVPLSAKARALAAFRGELRR